MRVVSRREEGGLIEKKVDVNTTIVRIAVLTGGTIAKNQLENSVQC